MRHLKRANIFYRFISISIDLIIVIALAYLYIFLHSFLLNPIVDIVDFLVGICFAGMLIAFSECLSGTSPGKHILELRIKIHDNDWPYLAKFERAMMKYGALILFLFYYFLVQIGPLSWMGIPAQILITAMKLYVCFTFLSFLLCLRSSRLTLHDQISGTAVCYIN